MWLCVMIVACGLAVGAAEGPGPVVTVRVNGRGASETAVELWRGEPVIVAVELRHPERGAKEALVLEPPAGGWATRVKVVMTDAAGAVVKAGFVVGGKPSAGGLALKPDAVTTLVMRMEPGAWSAVAVGRYRVGARLELADGKGWRGTVESEAVDVEVVEGVADPKDAALGRRQLLRVNDALLAGDVPRAEGAMREMLKADARRPEGFVAMALVAEGKGEFGLAVAAIDLAIARAAEANGAAAGAKGKEAPLEYYELRKRFAARAGE